MAKLSDIELSHKEEEVSIVYHEASQLAKSSAPQLVSSQYLILKLVDSKRKGRVHIDGIDDIFNPETKKTERIWLLNGVESIYQKDLTEILKDKDFVKNNRRSLLFEGGICRIPNWDTNAIEFARKCRHFIDNPDRKTGSKLEFFEWNPKRQAEAAMNKRIKKVEAMKNALAADVDKMRKHALYLGVSFVDELGEPKTEDGIRNDYVLKDEENPENFLETFDDKRVDISYLVKQAIKDAKIDLGKQKDSVYWANGGFIAKVPASRTAQEFLVELAMSHTDEGKIFLDQLKENTKVK
jgi:hypothetical protein